jgi:hypothetical protein
MPGMAVFLAPWFRSFLYVAQVLSEWFWNSISIVRSLYFRTFSVSFLITFLQHQSLLLSLCLLFLLLSSSSSSFCEAYYFNHVQILLRLNLSLITSKSIHTFDHWKERQINITQPKCYFTFYESEITSTNAARFQTHEHFNTRNLKTILWIQRHFGLTCSPLRHIVITDL